jgi:hypothetical protein
VIVPILGPGISLNEVPGPVNEYPVVRVDDPNAAARLRDAINQLASELHLAERGGGRAQSELESFMRRLDSNRFAVGSESGYSCEAYGIRP